MLWSVTLFRFLVGAVMADPSTKVRRTGEVALAVPIAVCILGAISILPAMAAKAAPSHASPCLRPAYTSEQTIHEGSCTDPQLPVAPEGAVRASAQPSDVAVPEAATISQAVAAGAGFSASSTPVWAFLLALLGMIGAGIAGLRLLGPRE